MSAARQVEAVETDELDTIRNRIRERLTALRMSGNEVSRKAGLGLSYVNDLLGGNSKRPNLHNLERVADALKCDLGYITGQQATPRGGRQGQSQVVGAPVVAIGAPRRSAGEAIRIPLYASPWPDEDGFFVMREQPDEMTGLPFEAVAGSYAVLVPDDTMAPRFMIGEKVFANPNRPILPGSFVVVRMKDSRAIIRKVDSMATATVTLTAIATDEKQTIGRGEIDTIHRITASSEA